MINSWSTSVDFWIDEFIEKTWLAVASRGEPLFPLFPRYIYQLDKRKEKSKYMTLFFLFK